MRKLLYWTSILILGLVFSSPTLSKEKQTNAINALADLFVKRYFQFYPQAGTLYGIKDANHADPTDNTLESIQLWYTFEDSLYAALKKINQHTLPKQQKITYGMLLENIESSIENRICKLRLWRVDQVVGWQVIFDILSKAQPVGSEENRGFTLKRWKKIPGYISNEVANLKQGIASGYSAPKQNVRAVIEQLDEILSQPVESSFFYSPAQRDSLPSFGKQLATIIEKEIYPSITAYRNYLRDEYLKGARSSLSLADLPNGVACYQARLRNFTTLRISPEQVYIEGVGAIAQREMKMKEIGQAIYRTSYLKTIKEKLRSDSTDNFSSRDELLAYAKGAVQRAKAKMPNYFTLLPKAEVQIQPLPAFQEKTGHSRYTRAAEDGSRPGTYEIQLYQPQKQKKGEVESVTFHEAYPGHHLQIGIAQELGSVHPVSKFLQNSGFIEGWGRYSETLADEIQLYSSDKRRLLAYASLPTGMVVDPGIHLKKWSRDQAIEYVLEKQSDMTREEAEAYVDRIAVWPGQMTTYGVGEIHFKNLRKLAEAKKGATFDIKEFHDKCLENGTIPLNMLSEHINQWLQKEQ